MFEGQWNAFLCLCVCSVKAVVMIVRYYISMTTLVKHSGAHSSECRFLLKRLILSVRLAYEPTKIRPIFRKQVMGWKSDPDKSFLLIQ